MDIRDPPWAQANFLPPLCTGSPSVIRFERLVFFRSERSRKQHCSITESVPLRYDVDANPYNLTLMMINWENWRRADIVTSKWKSHWWLYSLCSSVTLADEWARSQGTRQLSFLRGWGGGSSWLRLRAGRRGP